MTAITSVEVHDVRFPTSLSLDGSDAMNKDGDYSAAYVVLRTDDPLLSGYGMTFTSGRGNELCALAARMQAERLVGLDVATASAHLGEVHRQLSNDTQLRWVGPEKGVIHLALAAVMNAVWDLCARRVKKPLWRFVADLSPREVLAAADRRYVTDVLSDGVALRILESARDGRDERIGVLEAGGYPCYTTSPGWLGYDDDKLRRLSERAIAEGFTHIKLKVGLDLDEDRRRCAIARSVLGSGGTLLIDANQVWEIDDAIEWTRGLAEFSPLFIEEPTSPDDILGHARIRKAVAPVGVASGEVCHNRVMFKQFLQADALDYVQLDTGRLASVNEILTVQLLAAAFGKPVWPHAGGVGLCGMVSHVVAIDYVVVSGTMADRVAEYIDHLHEHFVSPPVVENGRYKAPWAPGYGTEIKEESVERFSYPDGPYWSERIATGKAMVAAPVKF